MSKASDDRRIDVLKRLIHLGMARSRQGLPPTKELVQTFFYYGGEAEEDASSSLFAGGTEMLMGTVEDMLDKVHDQVLQHNLPTYLKDQGIEEMLNRFDDIVQTLEEEDAWMRHQDEQDQASAVHALQSSMLPVGVTLEQMVDYTQYQKALVQRDAMTKALEQVQDEIASLEQDYAEGMSHVREQQQQTLQTTAQALTRSADLCSMVGQ